MEEGSHNVMSLEMRKAIMAMLGVGLIIAALCTVGNDMKYWFKEETVGIIQSDSYLENRITVNSRYPEYIYSVKYEVDGVEYESFQYISQYSCLEKGEQVVVCYVKGKPEEVIKDAISFTSPFLLYLGIKAFYYVFVTMK